jgi:hypothetical protein
MNVLRGLPAPVATVYRRTPLRLRGNVIARLIRPQPERASLACPAVEPNTRAGLFLWWPSEAQGRPLTAIADVMCAGPSDQP